MDSISGDAKAYSYAVGGKPCPQQFPRLVAAGDDADVGAGAFVAAAGVGDVVEVT